MIIMIEHWVANTESLRSTALAASSIRQTRVSFVKKGRESIEDEPRNGRPSVSKTAKNIVRVRDLVHSDRRLTVRMIGEELDLNHTTVHHILTNELKMRKICAKMVPKNS
ncbi:uncharacterized protein TNCV_4592461 [Trichonephila clavipes]|nr:uncharacterized protein TNCV_4592461 [Trichonephila clavipes]